MVPAHRSPSAPAAAEIRRVRRRGRPAHRRASHASALHPARRGGGVQRHDRPPARSGTTYTTALYFSQIAIPQRTPASISRPGPATRQSRRRRSQRSTAERDERLALRAHVEAAKPLDAGITEQQKQRRGANARIAVEHAPAKSHQQPGRRVRLQSDRPRPRPTHAATDPTSARRHRRCLEASARMRLDTGRRRRARARPHSCRGIDRRRQAEPATECEGPAAESATSAHAHDREVGAPAACVTRVRKRLEL